VIFLARAAIRPRHGRLVHPHAQLSRFHVRSILHQVWIDLPTAGYRSRSLVIYNARRSRKRATSVCTDRGSEISLRTAIGGASQSATRESARECAFARIPDRLHQRTPFLRPLDGQCVISIRFELRLGSWYRGKPEERGASAHESHDYLRDMI